MPWNSSNAKEFTKKAKSPKSQRKWAHVANAVLAKTGDEGSAIRQANAVVRNSGRGDKGSHVVRRSRG
jgi:hypothetical protein